MSSIKRKLPETGINRRVRARREDSAELEVISSSTDSQDDNTDSEVSSSGQENQSNLFDPSISSRSDSGSNSDSDPEPPEVASISFGALAKAQASLSNSKKISSPSFSKTKFDNDDGWSDNEARERKAGKKDHRHFGRSSKHAPTEISSKKAVSRKREVIPVAKRQVRDPRFDPISGAVDERKLKKAYAFLDDYRDDEMKTLRAEIKKTKDEDEKAKLKRTLLSMESKKKTDDRKRKAEEVLAKHKKEEKELVKQGKQPYYLKEVEKKKRILLETYSGMKQGELDHVIERRRRKLDQKEKKKLPWARRDAGP